MAKANMIEPYHYLQRVFTESLRTVFFGNMEKLLQDNKGQVLRLLTYAPYGWIIREQFYREYKLFQIPAS